MWLPVNGLLQPLRTRLYEGITELARAGAAVVNSSNGGSRRLPSPDLLLQWLQSGVLLQQQHHHHMPFSTATAVTSGDAATPALAGSAASWGVRTPGGKDQGSLLRLPEWLLQLLLPRRPSGLLLLLYGAARDAVCIGGTTFPLFVFAVLPLLFCFSVILFFLPA